MNFAVITKDAASWRVSPNLVDHARTRAEFTRGAIRGELQGLPDGAGLNIAHEAVDRHGYGKLTMPDEAECYLIAKAGRI